MLSFLRFVVPITVVAASAVLASPALAGTERISVSSAGAEANAWSVEVATTNDGRAAFASDASNLFPGDNNGVRDVFFRSGTSTQLISVSQTGGPANGQSSGPDVSPAGRCIAFMSDATNLTGIDLNGRTDVFVRQFNPSGTAETRQVSLTTTSRTISFQSPIGPPIKIPYAEGDGDSTWPSGSLDCRFVAFLSNANLAGDGARMSLQAIFVRDRDTDQDAVYDEDGAVKTVLIAGAGRQNFSKPVISADGRQVAFVRDSTVYVVDRDPDADGVFDETPPVSRQLGCTGCAGMNLDISWNGRFIAFESLSSCVAGTLYTSTCPINASQGLNVYVYDRDLDGDHIFDEPNAVKMTNVSTSTSGAQANAPTSYPSISADGQLVAFISVANNLVSGDTNGPKGFDVFVRDRDTDHDYHFDEPGAATTVRASVGTDGAQVPDFNGWPIVFAPAVYHRSGTQAGVFFMSFATNLVPGDNNRVADIFLRTPL